MPGTLGAFSDPRASSSPCRGHREVKPRSEEWGLSKRLEQNIPVRAKTLGGAFQVQAQNETQTCDPLQREAWFSGNSRLEEVPRSQGSGLGPAGDTAQREWVWKGTARHGALHHRQPRQASLGACSLVLCTQVFQHWGGVLGKAGGAGLVRGGGHSPAPGYRQGHWGQGPRHGSP